MFGLLEIIKKNFLTYNFFIYIFLIWNAFKLYFINSDPIIQVLNLLLSIGIYFCIEDKKLKLTSKRRIDVLMGIIGISLTIFRSFLLNNVEDKYYYFNLPIGILCMLIIFRPFNEYIYLKKIFLISLLLPFRRVFFELVNYAFAFLIPFFTWFVLFCLGKNPILDGENIFIGSQQIIIAKNCLGADNLYFVLATLIIYFCIFRLRKTNNLKIIFSSSIAISILINIIRNTLLALIVSSNIKYKENLFYFLHESLGSLTFSFFSVLCISCLYFTLLNKELEYK